MKSFFFDEKGIDKIKKKYRFKDSKKGLDSCLKIDHLLFTKITNEDSLQKTNNYFVIPIKPSGLKIIGIANVLAANQNFDRTFVTTFLDGSLPSSIYSSINIDSINFVGRAIQLGPPCRWMSVNNIQCPDMGQMSWDILRSLEEAKKIVDLHYSASKKRTLIKVISEEWLDTIFEGKETKVKRVKYKVTLPKMLMGGSNELIVYYVVQEVRGYFVACVLSQYYHAGEGLAPLLSEVMLIK